MMAEATQHQALVDVTQAVMGLLDSWQLDTREIQGVLSLPETVRARALMALRRAQTKGVYHARTVSRTVSRLQKGLQASQAS